MVAKKEIKEEKPTVKVEKEQFINCIALKKVFIDPDGTFKNIGEEFSISKDIAKKLQDSKAVSIVL